MAFDMVAYQKQWYQDHKDELLIKRRANGSAKAIYAKQYYIDNKDKVADAQRKRYEDTDNRVARAAYMKGYSREWHINNRYNLSVGEYEAIIAKGCSICGSHENVYMDHNHDTGSARAALCAKHNTGLGLFGDDIEQLRMAIEYLMQFEDVLGDVL